MINFNQLLEDEKKELKDAYGLYKKEIDKNLTDNEQEELFKICHNRIKKESND